MSAKRKGVFIYDGQKGRRAWTIPEQSGWYGGVEGGGVTREENGLVSLHAASTAWAHFFDRRIKTNSASAVECTSTNLFLLQIGNTYTASDRHPASSPPATLSPHRPPPLPPTSPISGLQVLQHHSGQVPRGVFPLCGVIVPQSQDLQVTQVTAGAQDVGQHAAPAQRLEESTHTPQHSSTVM